MKTLLIIFLFVCYHAAAESKAFIEVCNTPSSQVEFNQVKWLKKIFSSASCVSIYKKLKKTTSLTSIIPSKFAHNNEDENIFVPIELRETELSFNKFISDWQTASALFVELSLFREFENITHYYFETEDSKSICDVIKQVPSIKSIGVHIHNLSYENIKCIRDSKLKIYVTGIYYPSENAFELKNQIYGIADYRGSISDLYLFKNLNYLGLLENLDSSNLKVLTLNKNLNNLHINIQNYNALDDIKHLKNLSYLSLKCNYVKEGNNCRTRNLENLNFLTNLKFLKGLDLSNSDLNNLDRIEEFQNLEIFISRNTKIKSLANISLLKHLKLLDLSWNELQKIDDLQKLKGLKFLNISGNNIENISPLEGLKDLEHLSIGNNPFKGAVKIPNLRKLKSLRLDFITKEIEENSHQLNIGESILTSTTLDVTEAILVKMLFSEKHRKPNSRIIRDYSKINISLDLKKHQKLNSLSITNVFLSKDLSFRGMTELKYLNLSGSQFSENQFTDMSKAFNLEALILRKSSLAEYLLNSSLYFPKLEIIDFGYNDLQKISSIKISEKLKYVYLNKCNLREMPESSSFSNNISILDIGSNYLNKIELKKMKNLTQLDLSYNSFAAFPDFSQNIELNYVYLDGNSLKSVNPVTSKNIEFSLDKNPIETSECPLTSTNESINRFCASI